MIVVAAERQLCDDFITPLKLPAVDTCATYTVFPGLFVVSVHVIVIDETNGLPQLKPLGVSHKVNFHEGDSVVVDLTPSQFSAITLPQYVVFGINAVVFVEPSIPQKVSLETMAVPSAKFVDDN